MTIITFPLSELRPAHPHLRRFNVRTDLRRVADLVEQCFADTLDLDGRRYVQQMRRTSEHARFLTWASGVANRASFPFSGFVWEQEGAIVGNLSLIPMNARKSKIFLIANVAVHPDYRRRGIARKLTEYALEDCRSRKADEVWLHVREDNAGARALYNGMEFRERARRASWQFHRRVTDSSAPAGVRICGLQHRHWHPFLKWMNRLHPDHLDWYLPLNLNIFRPGLIGMLHRFFSSSSIRVWAAERGAVLLAALAWQRTYAAMDRLWLTVPEKINDLVVESLITSALSEIPTTKPLHLEFPAGLATGAIEAAGFTHNHTLIWMQYGGLNDRNGSSS